MRVLTFVTGLALCVGTASCTIHMAPAPAPVPMQPQPAAVGATAPAPAPQAAAAPGQAESAPSPKTFFPTVAAPPVAQPSPSQRYTISIVGAVIGPGKYPSGVGWDPNGKSVPSAVWPIVQTKLGQGPTKVLEYITTEVLNSYAAPDARGWAELIGGGKAADLRLELDPRSNTFVPNWTDKDWRKATIGPGTIVRVKLEDYDAFNKWNADDPIGMVDITSAQLLAAAKAGGVQYVDVSKATQMQLLYVQIAVRPE